ncbi:MAG: VWA domain-containing protein [Planctomycetes bacterium]|nr:VWA domain-containing protein [Planctomycetota bacterium]
MPNLRIILFIAIGLANFAPIALAEEMDRREWQQLRRQVAQMYEAGSVELAPTGTPQYSVEYARLEQLRIDAVRMLSGIEKAEATNLLLDILARDKSYKVRRDCVSALGETTLQESIEDLCEYLSRRGLTYELGAQLLLAIGHIKGSDKVRETLTKFLDSEDHQLLIAAVDAVAFSEDDFYVDKLFELIDHDMWALQHGCARALSKTAKEEHVFQLCSALRKSSSKLVSEILVDALKRITSGNLGPDPDAWESWWRSVLRNRAAGNAFVPGGGDYAQPQPPTYYGMKISSDRICFVIDISGSMSDPVDTSVRDRFRGQFTADPLRPDVTGPPPIEPARIFSKFDLAVAEFTRAAWFLPERTRFNLVVYSSGVSRWKDKLVFATPANRQEAIDYMKKLGPMGATNIWDALVEAARTTDVQEVRANIDHPYHYQNSPDTIYFLTDGVPMLSKYATAEEHLNAFYDFNLSRHLIVNTVGIGADHDKILLQGLAEMSGGTYVDGGK